jgi:exodeoxyribonuclease-3
VKYSWWSFRAGARDKNIGWRIDYVLVSRGFENKVKEAFILNEVIGSDHCPVGIVW